MTVRFSQFRIDVRMGTGFLAGKRRLRIATTRNTADDDHNLPRDIDLLILAVIEFRSTDSVADEYQRRGDRSGFAPQQRLAVDTDREIQIPALW